MKENKNINELSREELKDLFINLISGHEKEPEIHNIIAHFTVFNMENEVAEKFNLLEYSTGELLELTEGRFISDLWEEEDENWNIVLDTLSPNKIIDIIDNIDNCIRVYNEAILPVDCIKWKTLQLLYQV